ncbi:MAG: NADH-quinone oxidoreductase subunit C [Chitinophagales bacterium]
MTKEELKTALQTEYPSLQFEDGNEWLTAYVDGPAWHELAAKLRFDDNKSFDYLFCLTCVDWKTHLTMVYHLTSTSSRQILVVKSKLDRNNPEISSVSDIWKTADFHEREVYELFGVKFLGHPDLRKLILPDDWIGFPLRKDYEDPVNMIKL